jgi:hypothetical protein
MCIYSTTQESTEAFKKIWTKGYGGKLPTLAMANAWTGRDKAAIWLRIVLQTYNK